MNCKFCSVFLDHSGYGKAARNMLLSMLDAGINISTEIVSFAREKTIDRGGQKAIDLENLTLDYDTKLIMLTPENYESHMEQGKKNIGILFWEVIGVDKRWVEAMNKMDEIWTPSKIFAQTFIDNGVTVPVKVIKQPISNDHKKKFKFYSIFQWTVRKNPKSLLQAYWKTFQGITDVKLIIKTYKGGFGLDEQKQIIDEIESWKFQSGFTVFPEVELILNELSDEEIIKLHKRGDCFVSAHMGEGWGYPQMEAMEEGKPIISTNFGGIHELLNNNIAWLIGYDFVPVRGMEYIPWYNPSQNWADVKINDFGKAMMEAYTNKKLTRQKGKLAKKFVEENLSSLVVGNSIKELL